MSRVIKFRAWDTEHPRAMFQVPSLFAAKDGSLHYDLEKHRGRCILMQFTGLQDKHGRDIYEGDIVEVDTSYDDEGLHPTTYKDEVRFADGAFYPVCELPTDTAMTVIGNIYANPELISSEAGDAA